MEDGEEDMAQGRTEEKGKVIENRMREQCLG